MDLAPDFKAQVDAEVDDLVADYAPAGDPAELHKLADETDASLTTRGAATFDPPDETFWRAVVAELRRRAIRPV